MTGVTSHVAKGLLPYHGLGSGIKRALEKWPAIDFADDHDGCLFTATVRRKPVGELDLANITPEGSLRTDTVSGMRRESVGDASEMRRRKRRRKSSLLSKMMRSLLSNGLLNIVALQPVQLSVT
jgi:ATP-dependent DNA helicase RecG